MPRKKEEADDCRVKVHPACLPFSLAPCGPQPAPSNLTLGQLTLKEFEDVLPILLSEVAKSTTLVYDRNSFVRPDDAVEALILGSKTLTGLTAHFGKHYGRARLHWALIVAMIEAHKDEEVPVASFGNGIIIEYGRRLFGGEAKAWDIYRAEKWMIWDDQKQPRDCIQIEMRGETKWCLAPLGSSRKIITRLRVRSLDHSSTA